MAISQRRRKEPHRTTVATEPDRDMMTLFGIVARNLEVLCSGRPTRGQTP
jgi:hypothetical protein